MPQQVPIERDTKEITFITSNNIVINDIINNKTIHHDNDGDKLETSMSNNSKTNTVASKSLPNEETTTTSSALQPSISTSSQNKTATNISHSSDTQTSHVDSNNTNNNNTKPHTLPPPPPPPPLQQQATKLNGLKNRIIQRPPPLVLDKVSNFYVNDANDSNTHPQLQQQQPKHQSHQQKARNSIVNNHHHHHHHHHNNTKLDQLKLARESSTTSIPANFVTQATNDVSTNERASAASSINSANQKFWASLNENASRNKALANARSLSATIVDESIATSKAQEKVDTLDSLGPDLIIKHKSNGNISNISKSRVVSTLSTRRSQTSSNYSQKLERNTCIKPTQSGSISKSNHQNLTDNRCEVDDNCTRHGNSGGNLIGVDNQTPPAIDSSLDQPSSATGSRPRSNNPFLDEADDVVANYEADKDCKNKETNFHKRPASFIAATDRLANFSKLNAVSEQGQIVEEKLNEMRLNDSHHHSTLQSNDLNRTYNIDLNQLHVEQQDQTSNMDQAIQHNTLPAHLQQHLHFDPMMQHQPIIYGANDQRTVLEPSISIDSESTICQPPPSATMLLPHWSDAIYELNNAILELSSIGGGAENGQFIFIVENGDIILELDHIKVSGFTLVEFKELIESKQFHLLTAVQTKHSHGLTHDLKSYLNLSFPRDCKDKQLQLVIRENIYRQTIPCTTRPPKVGEIDKVDYHFVSKEKFAEMNNLNMLLECGIYAGHFYGTMKPLCDLNQLCTQSNSQHQAGVTVRQAWDANHPVVGPTTKIDTNVPQSSNNNNENPLYENQESLRMQQLQLSKHDIYPNNNPEVPKQFDPLTNNYIRGEQQTTSVVALDSDSLPPGWERVIDQTHGTYYIDHNSQRTQYERPYEVELTKGSMGFGFTLVEADNGLLLVRSIIQGGPAHMNGTIKPGDILISAVGVSVSGLQHTDIARLFSTFAVGDRVRLTFARSNYILDVNLIPDEYLFSNGTNGDMAVAVNSTTGYLNQNTVLDQSPHILVNQEFEYMKVALKRGDQGFGFTISDSIAGQRVRKIQNHEICSNLKQGDILTNLNGEDITKLTHKEVVERLKNCPAGKDVTLTVKRKKRFRSKTPMAMHTDATDEYSLDSTPQRNCKTPSLDGLMLRRPANLNSNELSVAKTLFESQPQQSNQQLQQSCVDQTYAHYEANSLPLMQNIVDKQSIEQQPLYGSLPVTQPYMQATQNHQLIYGPINSFSTQPQIQQPVYYNQQQQQYSLPQMPYPSSIINESSDLNHIVRPIASTTMPRNIDISSQIQSDNFSIGKFHPNSNGEDINKINQYNNFMNNDKFVMMQMQQQQQQQHLQPSYQAQLYSSDYHQVPLYSNSEIINNEVVRPQQVSLPTLPIKPPMNQLPMRVQHNKDNYQTNFYANNEEIALQNVNYDGIPYGGNQQPAEQFTFMQSISHGPQTPHDEHDEFEYHHVELERENGDSNWGIRLIGGAEVDRAISIGSMIFGGVASKSGKLKSGDEIISIDGVSVVGATHQHVVELISACSNRVSLVVRRKMFAEACDVILSKEMDEGFGFVIISSENCALIGKIIEGSPADRCKQLRVRDCIVAVNGRYITPNMKHPEIVNMIKECGSTLKLKIIPVDCYTVKLIKDTLNDSFGFRMRGGLEYDGTPLYIVRVEPGGQADGLLNVGDQILEINNLPTVGMTHQQAAFIIKHSDPIVKLKLRRNFVTPPSLLVDSPRALQKFNQVTAEIKTVNQNGTLNHFVGSHDGLNTDKLLTNSSFSSLPM